MIGILVLLVYGFMFFIFWKISKGISTQVNDKKNADLTKWGVFLFLCGTPFYVYFFQKWSFDNQCDVADFYGPNPKERGENILYVDDTSGKYYSSLINQYGFSKIATPESKGFKNAGQLINLNPKIKLYEVNADKSVRTPKEITKKETQFLGENIRFGLFNQFSRKGNYSSRQYYIYDFELKGKISNTKSVNFKRSQSDVLYYLLPYSFRGCGEQLFTDSSGNFELKKLLEMTFYNGVLNE